jgi:hypothetical protein
LRRSIEYRAKIASRLFPEILRLRSCELADAQITHFLNYYGGSNSVPYVTPEVFEKALAMRELAQESLTQSDRVALRLEEDRGGEDALRSRIANRMGFHRKIRDSWERTMKPQGAYVVSWTGEGDLQITLITSDMPLATTLGMGNSDWKDRYGKLKEDVRFRASGLPRAADFWWNALSIDGRGTLAVPGMNRKKTFSLRESLQLAEGFNLVDDSDPREQKQPDATTKAVKGSRPREELPPGHALYGIFAEKFGGFNQNIPVTLTQNARGIELEQSSSKGIWNGQVARDRTFYGECKSVFSPLTDEQRARFAFPHDVWGKVGQKLLRLFGKMKSLALEKRARESARPTHTIPKIIIDEVPGRPAVSGFDERRSSKAPPGLLSRQQETIAARVLGESLNDFNGTPLPLGESVALLCMRPDVNRSADEPGWYLRFTDPGRPQGEILLSRAQMRAAGISDAAQDAKNGDVPVRVVVIAGDGEDPFPRIISIRRSQTEKSTDLKETTQTGFPAHGASLVVER